MRSHQDLTFSTRIQDGTPRDNQRDKKENAWQAKKTYRFFIEFYEVLIGPRFFHKDPVWDRKGQPKGRKLKMSDR